MRLIEVTVLPLIDRARYWPGTVIESRELPDWLESSQSRPLRRIRVCEVVKAPEWAARIFQCAGSAAAERLVARGLVDDAFREAVEVLLTDDFLTTWSMVIGFVQMQAGGDWT